MKHLIATVLLAAGIGSVQDMCPPPPPPECPCPCDPNMCPPPLPPECPCPCPPPMCPPPDPCQDGATPSPRITAPMPNTYVAPGKEQSVSYETNAKDLKHQLLLLDKNNPTVLVNWVDFTPTGKTGNVKIGIPDGEYDYYLMIQVDPTVAKEQNKHSIPITTIEP